MKGLIIKDFLLLKNQKRFFLILIIIGVFMIFTGVDVTFISAYITFLVANVALSTISYDDYENSAPYLFSLPVTRKGYVNEKYVFTILCAVGSWLASMLLTWIYLLVRNQQAEKGVWISGGTCLLIAIIFISICLPLWLKLGAEKARLAVLVIAVAGAMITVLISKVMDAKTVIPAVESILEFLEGNLLLTSLGCVVFVMLILAVSYAISLGIVRKKEY